MASAPTTPDIFDLAAQPPSTNSGDVFDQAAKAGSPTQASGAAVTDNRSLLERLANDPNNIPLDSYTDATLHGIASIGQGVAQAVQGTAQAVRHPIDTVKNMVSGVKALPAQAVAVAKNPPTLNEVGDVAGQTAGQIVTGLVGGKAVEAGVKTPFAVARTLQAAKTLTDVPKALDADATATLATIADREGLPPLQSESIREASDELSKSFVNRAKQQYAVVDKAVGGDLKPVQEKIQSYTKAVRINANANPELAEKYANDLAEQKIILKGLIDKAKANGVPNAEDLMKAGDADYARGKAMENITKKIKTAAGEAKNGGKPDPTKFAAQIDVANNLGLLQRALGPDGAQAMIKTAREGLTTAKQARTIASTPGVQTVVKVVKGVKAAARLPKETPTR